MNGVEVLRDDLAVVSVAVPGEAASDEAIAAMKFIRSDIVPAAFNGTDASIYVGGPTAGNSDFFDVVDKYTPWVFAFVLGFSFVLLTLIFRSLVVPVKSIIMNLLSVGASYGVVVAIFQWGWLADPLGFTKVPSIEAWLQSLDASDTPAWGDAIRVHGDYHLGQLLVTGEGLRVVDFEGEPSRSLAERRSKHSPLKDVAGMMRSLSYAVGFALRQTTDPTNTLRAERDALLSEWESRARLRFVNGYRERMRQAPIRIPSRETFDRLLALYEIEKVLYEVEYEARFRPSWLDVPVGGIRRLEDRLAQGE